MNKNFQRLPSQKDWIAFLYAFNQNSNLVWEDSWVQHGLVTQQIAQIAKTVSESINIHQIL